MQTTIDPDQAAKKEQKTTTAQDVSVDLTPVLANGTVCEIDAGDPQSKSFVKGGIIRLRGNPSFQVTWNLQPGDAPGLQFDTANPVWSSQAGCPGSACNDPQISVVSCTATSLITTVNPTPGGQNAVHVSLGWSNGQRCDPIIINN